MAAQWWDTTLGIPGGEGFLQCRGTVADGAAGGGDQPAIADEPVIEALVDLQLAGHPGRLEPRGEPMAVVEQRVEAADDQMRRRQAGEIGERSAQRASRSAAPGARDRFPRSSASGFATDPRRGRNAARTGSRYRSSRRRRSAA